MENNTKFDRSYLIGLVLMFVMYGAYMFFQQENAPAEAPPVASQPATNQKDTLRVQQQTLQADSAAIQKSFGNFASFVQGTEQLVTVENEDAIFTFSSKGGTLKEVTLKNYRSYANFNQGKQEPIKLINAENSVMALQVPTPTGTVDLKQLFYNTSAQPKVIKGTDTTLVQFQVALSPTQRITQTYKVWGRGYTVDYQVGLQNMGNAITGSSAKFMWRNSMKFLENDISENRKATQINYQSTEGDFTDFGDNQVSSENDKSDSPISWFSFKQKYFVSGIVARNSAFQNAQFDLNVPADSSYAKIGTATMDIPVADLASGKGNFTFYVGPNDYKLVKSVADGFNKNVYLGYDIVKPINRYVFVPLFNWFESFISNYGLLIIVVVLVIKAFLTPLIYKSYQSAAKMRILAPEVAAIKERVGDDPMKVQQETMKLYQQVGVSPLSGCVPMLLQMPILMSVFFLFPNMIMFRQRGFLWANDLSTYDAPLSWATTLPLIGNHISLFVVLMTISSLAFTYYNNQITPDQPGPVDMKKISYIFPLVFFFVLNSFPAALSFYYLVSNLVTIGQQLIVRKFIDEDKIRAVLEKNKQNFKNKPAKKQGKFSEFLQKQLQAQEELKRQQTADMKKKK